jgi:hypothetical protein
MEAIEKIYEFEMVVGFYNKITLIFLKNGEKQMYRKLQL